MSEIGTIKSFDPATNLVTIEFHAQGACKTCGVCLAGTASEVNKMCVTAKNTLNVKEGDKVEFEVAEGEMFKASMLLYGLPLALLLVGFILGRKIAYIINQSPDLISLLFAGVFFAGAFYILSNIEKSQGKQKSEHIILLRKTF